MLKFNIQVLVCEKILLFFCLFNIVKQAKKIRRIKMFILTISIINSFNLLILNVEFLNFILHPKHSLPEGPGLVK